MALLLLFNSHIPQLNGQLSLVANFHYHITEFRLMNPNKSFLISVHIVKVLSSLYMMKRVCICIMLKMKRMVVILFYCWIKALDNSV